MANNSLVDLFVAGARTVITVAHSRVKEITLDQVIPVSRQNRSGNVKDKKENKDEFLERQLSNSRTTSRSSSSSKSLHLVTQPVIWVNIAKKMTATVPIILDISNRESAAIPPILTVADSAKQERKMDAFETFLQENFKLMAEIQTAKKRRMHNRQISRALDNDDNINWTSNAPRPSENLVLQNRQSYHSRRKARKRSKSKIITDPKTLPKSLEGVDCKIGRRHNKHLTNVKPLVRSNRKRNLKSNCEYNVIDLPVIPFSFQLLDKKSESSALSKQTRHKVLLYWIYLFLYLRYVLRYE
jgi:hypothetical protein